MQGLLGASGYLRRWGETLQAQERKGDIQGYRITRGASATGPFAVVSELFRAQGDNHAYQVSDHVPAAARSYYYQLQIVGRDGSLSASSTAATVPGRVTKRGPAVR